VPPEEPPKGLVRGNENGVRRHLRKLLRWLVRGNENGVRRHLRKLLRWLVHGYGRFCA